MTDYMELDVNSLWHNMVAIRDKFFLKALIDKIGIRIKHSGEYMTIPYTELVPRVVHISPRSEEDKFGRDFKNKLVYFVWRKDA